MNILNTLSLSKYVNGKPECKCNTMSIYVIHRTNHAYPAVQIVYTGIYYYDK